MTAAGGVSPTAPDEHEALEDWSFEHRPILSMRDGSIAACKCMDRVFINGKEDWDSHIADSLIAAGFRRSREATTEPQPIDGMSLEELIEDRLHDAGLVWWSDGPGGSGQIVEGMKEDVIRTVLEAVEASRSPKDNGGRS